MAPITSNKNKVIWVGITLLGVIVLYGLIAAIIAPTSHGVSRHPAISTSPPNILSGILAIFRTPTPDRTVVAKNLSTARTPKPVITSLVVSKTIDLSPELTDNDKFLVWVLRSDGTVYQYFIGPVERYKSIFSVITQYKDITPEMLGIIPLEPGDEIYMWCPIESYKTKSSRVDTP